MQGIITWWAKNSVAANLLMFGCLIVGLLSYVSIEREVFPAGVVPFVTVNVSWLGADPQQVEEQIVLRIEEAISQIDGVKHIDSTAREGSANVQIEADPDVDIDNFLNEIKNQVDGISTFPNDAFPPNVQKVDASDQTHTLAVAGNLTPRELNRLARRLRDELTRIPYGSSLVELRGERDEEVAIEVSESALRTFGLTFSDVAQAIRGRSVNISSGTVRTETGNVPLAARGLADTKEEFEDIIIRQTADGGTVRVRDIATVVDGFADGNFRLELNNEKAILIQINAPSSLNIVEMSKSVDRWVEAKNKELAPNANITVINDSSDIYFARMKTVASNAIIGLFLVLIILILFLRPLVAFWVSAGIGVAFMGAFIFLPLVGVSLNILSLFGFLLVIGIIVDDAIIVGESIHNQVESGKKDIDAALIGTQLVIKPVFFAVLTSIIAFAPFLFLSGGTSEFTKHISWTITFALIFSLVESFFILPAHLSHMKKQNKDTHFYKLQGFFSEGLINFANNVYHPVLQLAIKGRYITVTFFIMACILSGALLSQGWIKSSFFPTIEGNQVNFDVTLAEGTSFNRTNQVYDAVQKAAREVKEELGQRGGTDVVETIFTFAFTGNVRSRLFLSSSDARGQLTTEQVAELWREKVGEIPDAEDISTTFSFNDNGPQLSFGIEGDNLESIRLALVDLQGYFRTRSGVFDIRNNLQSANDELRIELLPGAERFGLTLSQVSTQVRQAFFGEQVQRLPRGGDDVRVIVRLPKSDRENLGTLSRLFIRTADGREVPLASVAKLEFAPAYRSIRRRDRKRSGNIRASLTEGTERRLIMSAFNEDFKPEWQSRHPDVSIRRRGAAEGEEEFLGELGTLYLIALFAIYMLLAIAFTSYFQPLLILSAIPFGFMGAMFGHALLGIEFGLFTFFGIGAAAGVVINDNLVLIDYVNRLRREGAGAVEALTKAGTRRFRPIILTSLTTFIGLVPVMLESSVDAQFLKPTIVAMAFGIFFAAFVTLLFVPAMYLVGADMSRLIKWAWTGEKQPKVGYGVSLEHGYDAPDDDGNLEGYDNETPTPKPLNPNPVIGPAE